LHPLRAYETAATSFHIKVGETDTTLTEFTRANGRLKFDIEPLYASCPDHAGFLGWTSTHWFYRVDDDPHGFTTCNGGVSDNKLTLNTAINAHMVFNTPVKFTMRAMY
jgi:hypothetical protein